MAEEGPPPSRPPSARPPSAQPARFAWRKYALALPVMLVAVAGLGLGALDTRIGHRLVADWIGGTEASNGLGVSIGRIEGSIYGTARLDDVSVRDGQGVFLRVPVVDLDWRPFAWWDRKLDIRQLALRRGVLLRAPALRVAAPDQPILPDFDIRLDQLVGERLTIAKGLVGVERRVDLRGMADIHHRRALITLDSRLGGGDRLALKLDADEAQDRFVLGGDYAAPKGGLLAALTGAGAAREAKLSGQGSWHDWHGSLMARQDDRPLAALALTAASGRYGLDGTVQSAVLSNADMRRAIGPEVRLTGEGRLAGGTLTGRMGATATGLRMAAVGVVDMTAGALHGVVVDAASAGALPLPGGASIVGARAHVTLDGAFAALTVRGHASADGFAQGKTRLTGVTLDGSAGPAGSGWRAPLRMTAASVVTGNPVFDARLKGLRASADLALSGSRLTSDNVQLFAPTLAARLRLGGDMKRGEYTLAGRIAARGLALAPLGNTDADADVQVTRTGGGGLRFTGRVNGRVARVQSAGIVSLVGPALAFSGDISGGGAPLAISRGSLSGANLTMALSGRAGADGAVHLVGGGHQATYGTFTADATFASDGPHAVLNFADPLPAAGVTDMRLTVDPAPGGFALTTNGGSTLGPFAGTLLLALPAGAPPRLEVQHFTLSQTSVTGTLTLASTGGASTGVIGDLAVAGGGITGTIAVKPQGEGQQIAANLTAQDARFGGRQPLVIGAAKIEANGLLVKNHSTLTASASLQGIGIGRLFIGRAAVNLKLADGRGQVVASLAGQRGSHFELQSLADIAPGQVALMLHGTFAGQPISMPRRAQFSRTAPGALGGWSLAPSEVDFGTGRVVASGSIGGGGTKLSLALAGMPLALGDVVVPDLGLGGVASGLFEYGHMREGQPTADARLLIKGLTRSGLVTTSRPIDLALTAQLASSALEFRAVASDRGKPIGRVQARISGLPAGGDLLTRLRGGNLAAGARYSGPAEAPWRMIGIDAFDLTGPVDLAADITGTLTDPHIRGSLAGDALHLESAITGTDMTQVHARGVFAGSRLTLSELSGRTAGGGSAAGSGNVDFSGIGGGRGPGIDLALSVRRAMLLARSDMALAVSGPLRIVSDGLTGTVAGRLRIDSAKWRLGAAPSAAALPDIRVREINQSADIAQPASKLVWNYMIDAAGPGGIRVIGLGLDSQWSAKLHLRGTFDAPAILGSADLVSGNYEFAGQHFDLTRGHIGFDGSSPPDPLLDIAAQADVNGLSATVTVRGTSLKPDIEFSSIPALPEEELLSRLLFGDGVSKISAPEAVQLGAALAALHGGGGLDPINALRSAIGLDRLRIVGADPTQNRGTGVALGKYLGRHFYAEIISDGRGYSATNLEFRVTRWLSLLGSVSTVGRQSLNARVSKDY